MKHRAVFHRLEDLAPHHFLGGAVERQVQREDVDPRRQLLERARESHAELVGLRRRQAARPAMGDEAESVRALEHLAPNRAEPRDADGAAADACGLG